MKRHLGPFGSTTLIGILDLLLLHTGFWATVQALSTFSLITPIGLAETHIAAIALATVVAFALFYLFDLYGDWVGQSVTDIVIAVTFVVAGTDLCGLLMASFFEETRTMWPWILLIIAAQVLLVAGARCVIKFFISGNSTSRTLLIVAADEKSAEHLAKAAEEDQSRTFEQYELVVAGELEEYDYRIRSADMVLLGPGIRERDDIIRCCAMFRKDAFIVPDPTDLLSMRGIPGRMGDFLTIAVHSCAFAPVQAFAKRLFDIVFSSIAIAVSAPVMVAIALAVRWTSKGPAIFRQERVGKDGAPYMIYKFRTMVDGAESATGPVLALHQDPRITSLGEFLRSTRMDELPQFFNVLKGEMSMVGPRPEREFFVRQFEKQDPMYALRAIVKPGITGLAQVLGRYATNAHDKLRFDLYYISNHSFLMDLRIILKTMVVVLQRRQAEGVTVATAVRRVDSVRPAARIAELEREESIMSD